MGRMCGVETLIRIMIIHPFTPSTLLQIRCVVPSDVVEALFTELCAFQVNDGSAAMPQPENSALWYDVETEEPPQRRPHHFIIFSITLLLVATTTLIILLL